MKAKIGFSVLLAIIGLLVLTRAAQNGSEEARKDLPHNLGSSFLVFRHNIQEELRLTEVQKERLEALLPDAILLAQKYKGPKSEEQKKELGESRRQEQEKLAAALRENLNEDQLTRLHQIELQREGLFEAESWKDLQLSDEQRQQFMVLIKQTQQEIVPLLEEAHRNGNPGEIRPKVMKLRLDLESNLEALLTDGQKKRWMDMLGKPMSLGALFDMTP